MSAHRISNGFQTGHGFARATTRVLSFIAMAYGGTVNAVTSVFGGTVNTPSPASSGAPSMPLLAHFRQLPML